jgi:ADP-heptose:LPS heptosyltransferase
MTIHTDCRHYRVSVPCPSHKRSGIACGDCGEYAPVDERILIVKLDAMGDVLRTTACLEPLKRVHPRSHVTWITRANAVPLLAGNPLVDRILAVESNYLEFVHAEEFELALGPDADALSAAIMLLAHARQKRGFVSDRRGGVVPLNAAAESWWRMGLDDALKKQNRRTYGEWLFDICELPPPIARPWFRPSAGALRAAARVFGDVPAGAGARVCFNTGAGPRWKEKRWKPHHYTELARLVGERWPEAVIALVGGPGEAAFNAALLASNAGFVDGGTDNSIDGFAALTACADWCLTSDSLGYHMACAVGTPAVCVVGPTSPWELDCYGTNRVLHADLDCIACYLQTCPLATTCMDALTARQVWMAMDGSTGFASGRGASLSPPATRAWGPVALQPRIPLRPIGGPRVATRNVAG